MYALIYDKHRLDHPLKRVISVHKNRNEAEAALERRRGELGRKVPECFTRVVWVDKEDLQVGEFVGPGEYDTWRPGELVPFGDLYSDQD
ncbi:MAG: hypothetical protein LJE65_14765 [Desulfobacteraceae bacterium]|nr:hypothetical protein [Desulfobacteraceae bacterium]